MQSKKAKILTVTFLTAVILSLGVYTYTSRAELADYRLASKYSAGQAFEETVRSVDQLSQALSKSVYATDGSMCSRLCSEAYANALAAEAAMSTLPFSTQELEQLSGFLNVAGDYAYTLAFESAEEGFTQEQLETLTDMAWTASGFAATLQGLRGGINEGSIRMDSRQARQNTVGGDEAGVEMLSARLLAYEQSFQPMAELKYDGMYGVTAKETKFNYNQDEMKKLAAQYAGCRPEELEQKYSYEGTDGRVCYSAGDTLINVSPAGVESMSQSRLVGEDVLSIDEALEAAEKFLTEQGFKDLQLKDSQINGAVALLRYARVVDEAVCLDNCLTVSVALDDGSIYGFNAINYSEDDVDADWNIDQEQAEATLPEGLDLTDCRKVIIRSAGEKDLACYELSCTAGERLVRIFIDAATGKQCRIEIGDRQEQV